MQFVAAITSSRASRRRRSCRPVEPLAGHAPVTARRCSDARGEGQGFRQCLVRARRIALCQEYRRQALERPHDPLEVRKLALIGKRMLEQNLDARERATSRRDTTKNIPGASQRSFAPWSRIAHLSRLPALLILQGTSRRA